MTDNVVKKTVGNLITKMKAFGFLHSDDVVTSWSPSVSNSKYATEKLVKDSLDTKENTSNKVTSISSSSTDAQYPSAKTVFDAINELDLGGGSYIDDYYFDTTTKEIVLAYTTDGSSSGSGSGSGGGTSVDIVTSWEQTPSDLKVASEKLVKDSLDTKAESTHNHTKSQITDFPSIPTKTSDLTNDSNFITSHQDISGKLDKVQTSYKGKNVVVDSSTGNITFEDKDNHTHSQYLTSHQSLANYIQKSNTQGLVKNDGTIDTSTYLTSHQSLTGYLKTTDVVDNLTSTSTTTPLSAKQGKVLKEYVDTLVGNIEEDMLS